jgi:predicted secreted hydrolase
MPERRPGSLKIPLGLLLACLLGAAAWGAEQFFKIPAPGRAFQFPRDHGAHPAYQTEWWYYSGHLQSGAGERFGYQLTFFRTALAPPDPKARSAWRTNTLYFAHLALSDPARGTFRFWEKTGRGALNLSGAEPGRLKVWIDNWRAELVDASHYLKARAPGLALDLTLTPAKPPVLNGEGGFSRKSARYGTASYYYSLPRLETRGRLTLGERDLPVSGLSWMDHEFFTGALAPDLKGWDWFALQLGDGWDLMLYLLRHGDGRVDPASSGTLIDPRGQPRVLRPGEFQVRATGAWKSPHSGATYPSGWEIDLPGAGYRLTLSPTLADQEIRARAPQVTYWEGEVRVRGRKSGAPISGQGFVELTGYAGPMPARF